MFLVYRLTKSLSSSPGSSLVSSTVWARCLLPQPWPFLCWSFSLALSWSPRSTVALSSSSTSQCLVLHFPTLTLASEEREGGGGGGGGKSLVRSVPHCESPLSSRYPPCIIAMAHRVVAQWFVRCRIQYRPAMARFISKVHITPSHLHTISSPHPHTLTLTPSHLHTITSTLSHPHTSHLHTLTPSPSHPQVCVLIFASLSETVSVCRVH